MNPKMVSSIVSIIPERVARAQSGTPFPSSSANARHGAQVENLSRFLQWLSPLNPITKEEQSALGITAPHGRHALEEEEDEPAS